MSKFSSYILISLLLITTVGYYPFFLILKKSAKNEAEDIVKYNNSQKIIKLQINKNEISSISETEKNEIRIENKLYDVVEKKVDKFGNITFVCYLDIKESKLYAQLEKQIESSTESKMSKNGLSLAKFLSFFQKPEIFKYDILLNVNKIEFRKIVILSNSLFQETGNPPPENLS